MPSNTIDIARNGGVAAAIKTAMETQGLTVHQLAAKLNPDEPTIPRASIDLWLSARGIPGAKYREKLAKVLHLKQADLTPRLLDEPDVVMEAERQRIYALHHGEARAVAVRQAPEKPVITFNAFPNGRARLQFDVELSMEKAWHVMRLLMDAGMMMQSVEEAA